MIRLFLSTILALLVCAISFSQSYQRMVVAKGVYELGIKGSEIGSSNIQAYCLDNSRLPPFATQDYCNFLLGRAEVVFGNEAPIDLLDAIKNGFIRVEGADIVSLSRLINFIRDDPKHRELNISDRVKKEMDIRRDYKSSPEKYREILMGISGYFELTFINLQSECATIKAITNIEFGEKKEKIAKKGVESVRLSAGQDFYEIQFEIWINETRENFERLQIIGEFKNQIPSNDDLFDQAKKEYSAFHTKYNLAVQDQSQFTQSMEEKIVELEAALKDRLIVIGESIDEALELKEIIRQYREKYSLGNGFVLDQKTSEHIEEKEQLLSSKLDATVDGILSLTLKEKIETYSNIRKDLKFQSDANDYFRSVLNSDENYYVLQNGEYFGYQKSEVQIFNPKTKNTDVTKTIKLSRESNVHIALTDKVNIALNKLNENLDWEYDLEEITVLSLTSNESTRRTLKTELPKNHISPNRMSERSIEKKMRRSKRKTFLVLGHSEKGAYYDDGIEIITIQRLNDLAQKNGLNIYHLTCSSASFNEIGTSASINTIHTVNALIPALKMNTNFKEFFLDFSNYGIGPQQAKVDLLINENTFENKGFTKFKLIQKGIAAAITTITFGSLLYILLTENEQIQKENGNG